MKYCTWLITEKLPTEEEITNIFSSLIKDKSAFEDYFTDISRIYKIGGVFNSLLKLKVDKSDSFYDWENPKIKERNGKMFHNRSLSIVKEVVASEESYQEENYYEAIGYNQGFLCVDGAKIKDILNLNEAQQHCELCIDVDKNVIARKGWNNVEWLINEDFDRQLEEILNQRKEMFITVLDLL